MFENGKDFVSPLSAADRKLKEADFIAAAERLRLPNVATIKAVHACESASAGFDKFGRPKILFESHVFNKLTQGRFLNKVSPSTGKLIANKEWDKTNYPPADKMYNVLFEAMSLDKSMALRATSWNAMQILGNNFGLAGFMDVESYVASMILNESNSLKAFVNFVLARQIDDEMRIRNWDGFAYIYNGAGYKRNKYAERMRAAYIDFGGTPPYSSSEAAPTTTKTKPAVAAAVSVANKNANLTGIKNAGVLKLQKWLNGLNILPVKLIEDSTYGRKTNEAIDLAIAKFGADSVKTSLLNLQLGFNINL